MFNVGDRVICIDLEHRNCDKNRFYHYDLENLKLYETYIVSNILSTNTEPNSMCQLVMVSGFFDNFRFVSVKEYRKQKLNKICLNQEIK
jgi:hypothetical protein